MSRVGINVNLDGRHSADWIRTFNARGARIVLTPRADLRARFEDYRANGVFVLAVLARESYAGFGRVRESDGYPLGNTSARAAEHYGTLYGDYLTRGAGAIQVGNEADHESPSSWTLPPADLARLGWEMRASFPEATLVCSGMTSGQPGYLDDVDLRPFDAIAVHPYAKDLTRGNDLPDADVLVAQYRRFGKPVWVTEWGWWGDEESGRQAVGDMVAWAKDTDQIEWYFHFCADDVMVEPFGLLRTDGSWKPAAEAFFAAMGEDVPPEPESDDFVVGDGLQKEIDRRGWTAASDEYTVPIAHATTPSGQLRLVVWDGGEALAYRRVN